VSLLIDAGKSIDTVADMLGDDPPASPSWLGWLVTGSVNGFSQ
jgi:hypothetical protein